MFDDETASEFHGRVQAGGGGFVGVEHAVTVLVAGYEYQGRPYRSLSAIARAITGTLERAVVLRRSELSAK